MRTIHLDDLVIQETDSIIKKLNELGYPPIKRAKYIRDAIKQYNRSEYRIILEKQYEMASKLTKIDGVKVLEEFEALRDPIAE